MEKALTRLVVSPACKETKTAPEKSSADTGMILSLPNDFVMSAPILGPAPHEATDSPSSGTNLLFYSPSQLRAGFSPRRRGREGSRAVLSLELLSGDGLGEPGHHRLQRASHAAQKQQREVDPKNGHKTPPTPPPNPVPQPQICWMGGSDNGAAQKPVGTGMGAPPVPPRHGRSCRRTERAQKTQGRGSG